jgi:hypothetical protein
LFEDVRPDNAVTGDKQDVLLMFQTVEDLYRLPGGVGSPEPISLVDENSIVKNGSNGFDYLSRQGPNDDNVLFDSARIVIFKSAIDGRLPVDGKTNFVTCRGPHAGAFAGSQNN